MVDFSMVTRLGTILTAAAMMTAIACPGLAQDYDAGVAAYNKGDYAAALKQFRPLATKGDVRAQHYLGIMYTQGLGVPKDYVKAVKWLELAAKAGHIPSAYNLGFRYLKGDGVRQDPKTAAVWIRRAAETGMGPAQHTLGLLYARGDGVDQDLVQAYFWFTLSAEKNNEFAAKDKDTIAKRMTPEQIKKAEALAAKWRPKEPQPVR